MTRVTARALSLRGKGIVVLKQQLSIFPSDAYEVD